MILRETMREPLRDIRAQVYAMHDPSHPKDAVWISRGTPASLDLDQAIYEIPTLNGTLYTNNNAKAQFFVLDQSEEGLAAVLGYLTPKAAINEDRMVVAQALDNSGAVITEMGVDIADIDKARDTLQQHGICVVVPLWLAMMRRMIWCAVEDQ